MDLTVVNAEVIIEIYLFPVFSIAPLLGYLLLDQFHFQAF